MAVSSGPVRDPPLPDDDLTEVTALGATVQVRGHRVFAGRLDRGARGWAEQFTVRAVHAAEGDFRDHDAIRSWAAEVAADLGGRDR